MKGAGVRVVAYGATNTGLVREANEDSYYTGSTVFAVADGMGGHAAGEVASEAALEPVAALDGRSFRDPTAATEALASALESANSRVFDRAATDPSLRGMGTTLTAVLLREGRLHLAHVGDSRAYLLRGGALQPLTTDHTLVQQLIDEGRLTPDQAARHPQRSVITRAIGVDAYVQVDTMEPAVELLPGDQVLLCSDGLTGPVTEEAIREILQSEPDGNVAVQRLLDAANANGGPDNITAVLLRAEGDGAAVVTAPVPARAGRDDDSTQELTSPGGTSDGAHSGGQPAVGESRREHAALVTGTTQIRTSDLRDAAFDAKKMGQYGAAGIDDTPSALRIGRRRRVVSVVIALIVLVALLGGGALVLLSRSYFVGVDDEGGVAVFRGINQEVLGVSLRSLVERTDIDADDLPRLRQQRLRDGESFGTLEEARTYVRETLRRDVDERPSTSDGSTGTGSRPAASPVPTDDKDDAQLEMSTNAAEASPSRR